MDSNTILELQSDLEIALQCLPRFQAQLPDVLKPLVNLAPRKGVRAHVSLRHAAKGRQIKRNAPAETWKTGPDFVLAISYEANTAEDREEAERHPAQTPVAAAPAQRTEDPVRDLVCALARAERDPQLNFVSLKWFRDAYLPQQGFAWATAPESRQRVLVEALDRRWVLTGKIANPKNPQFPVTAIRVNRPLPEVREVLGKDETSESDFAPAVIRGEQLSQTVLRERR
jgi:hypothetical protein